MAKRRGKKKAGDGRPRNKEEGASATAAPAPVLLAPLPDHLVEDIFTRLPPKSVAVSRCVSPSWNRLISSPAFGRLYHKAKAAEAASDPARFVSVPVNPHQHRHQRATKVWHESDVMPKDSACVECPRVFAGAGMPCHGVVLAGRPCRGEYFVCNPSTGGVLLLPPRRPPWYFYSAGLGYDAGAGKHKAVLLERVGGLPPVPKRWEIPRLQCNVVTVGARQWRWRAPRGRRTPIICEGSLVSDTTDPLFADGRLHWMLTERAADGAQGDLDGILAFVLGNESFKRIPLPPLALPSADHPPGYPPPLGATLAELDGRLCLLQDLRRRKHGVAVFDLWMLRDLTSGSWSLDRRIDLKPHVDKELMLPLHVSVLCYVGGEIPAKSKKKILLATTMGRVYLYDQDTGELHTVAKNKGCAKQYMRLVLYQDCIVQFDGMEYGKEDIKFKLVTEESNSEPGVAFHSEI